MDARALTCPQCGAAADAEATSCAFCHARLATVPCAKCFGLVFLGSKHCDHCGAELASADLVAQSPHRCPRGCGTLRAIRLGSVELEECEVCCGMWLRPHVFQRINAEEEHGAVVLGLELDAHAVQRSPVESVRYVPCPECSKIMNRINFAKRSGVVLDSCAHHGTWFDADELRRVVEFIRSGGLDKQRANDRMYLAEERRLLALKQWLGDTPAPASFQNDNAGSHMRSSFLRSMLHLLGEK